MGESQPAYRGLGLGSGSLPVCEAICREVLSLAMGPQLADVEIDRVVEVVRAFR